jgi:hypothetical protein
LGDGRNIGLGFDDHLQIVEGHVRSDIVGEEVRLQLSIGGDNAY